MLDALHFWNSVGNWWGCNCLIELLVVLPSGVAKELLLYWWQWDGVNWLNWLCQFSSVQLRAAPIQLRQSGVLAFGQDPLPSDMGYGDGHASAYAWGGEGSTCPSFFGTGQFVRDRPKAAVYLNSIVSATSERPETVLYLASRRLLYCTLAGAVSAQAVHPVFFKPPWRCKPVIRQCLALTLQF